MNTLIRNCPRGLLALLACLMLNSAFGAVNTWNGGAGVWGVPENWSAGSVPNIAAGGDDVMISGVGSDVNYVAGGDWEPRTTVTIQDGASWTQTGGAAWPFIYGTLIVDNATFDSGTIGQFRVASGGQVIIRNGASFIVRKIVGERGDSSVIAVEGGTYTVGEDNYLPRSGDIFAGGLVSLPKELWIAHSFTVSGSVIETEILAGQSAGKVITLTAGRIVCRSNNHTGYWTGGTYVDFTAGSKGMMTFAGVTVDSVYSTYFSGAAARLRYDGAAIDQTTFNEMFDVAESTDYPGSVDIALKQVAGAATFQAAGSTVSELTVESVKMSAVIEDPGEPAAELLACLGHVNGGTDLAAWEFVSPAFATAQANTAVAYTAALEPNWMYYYRVAASNETAVVFASATPAFFLTGEVGVESPVSSVSEDNAVGVALTLSRPSVNNCKDAALNVPFTVGGTAVLGTHYRLSQASPAVIPADAESTTVVVTPLPNPSGSGSPDLTVTFALASSARYLLAASNTVELTITKPVLPGGMTNVFVGVESDLSNVAGNWSLGLPTSEHVIFYSPAFTTRKVLQWTAGMTPMLAGWVQPDVPSASANQVMFHTTPSAPLTVTGDVRLEAGHWTHSGPVAEPTTAVAVSIGGDLFVAAGASINTGDGVANTTTGKQRGYLSAGPGYLPYVEGEVGFGASHGGEGAMGSVVYGSILNPLSYGSAGSSSDDDQSGYAGGGLIVLTVNGTATVNGEVLSCGFGYTAPVGRGASAGGTVNLVAGRLQGSGRIAANGGKDIETGSGGGGRVRIRLTGAGASVDGFSGVISAYGKGGSVGSNLPASAAGTVVLQTAADAAGAAVLVVDNDVSTLAGVTAAERATPLSQANGDNLRKTSLVLRQFGKVRLAENLMVQSLTVDGTAARILTDGYTLSLQEMFVNGVKVKVGTYTASDYPDLIVGGGTVAVVGDRTIILLK